MKNRNLKVMNMALASVMLSGAFSFSAFAQTKAETVKPKVKESKTTPKAETVEVEENEDKVESPKQASSPSSSSSNAGLLGFGNPHAHSVGFGLGQTFLAGKFNDYGDNRVSYPDLFYSYAASYSFDFLFNTHYTVHKAPNRETKLLGFAPAIKAKLFQFDAFAPFALGGLGFYAPQWSDHGNESKRKLVFGFNLGIGGDLKLNDHFGIGVLMHYHNPFDSKQDTGPKLEGSYLKLLLTGMYTF